MNTWIYYMTYEIHKIIWKMVIEFVMTSVIKFCRYKTMFRLALSGPIGTRVSFPRVNNDKFVKMPRLSNNRSCEILFDSGERCDPYTSWKVQRWITSGHIETTSACGILSNIKNLDALYQLCKVIDEDWINIGFTENRAASKYTYNDYNDLDKIIEVS